MKKIVFWGVFIQICILIALVSSASMTREPISEGNLSDLNGKWKGWRTVSGGNYRTEMEIYNDTLPLKGKFIFYDLQRRKKLGQTVVLEFKQGMIKDNNLYIKEGQNYFELSLYKDDGKMKLEGDFDSIGINGIITLNKK
jgi:hypothetical protein